VHIVTARSESFPVESHEEIDLLIRSSPVLGRERVYRQVPDAFLDRGIDYAVEGLLPFVMTGIAR
jgi:hypothetical protein